MDLAEEGELDEVSFLIAWGLLLRCVVALRLRDLRLSCELLLHLGLG